MKRWLTCYAISATLQKSISFGGASFSEATNLTGDVADTVDVTVLPAQPAALTVRTDNATGTLTMVNSNHGIITGQIIDLYFSSTLCRRQVVAGTVAGTSVPITIGTGDNLPIATTHISVGIPKERAFNIVGNNLQVIALTSPVQGQFVVVDNSEAELAHYHNLGGNVNIWYNTDGTTNPLAGVTAVKVWSSHNDETVSHDLVVSALRTL